MRRTALIAAAISGLALISSSVNAALVPSLVRVAGPTGTTDRVLLVVKESSAANYQLGALNVTIAATGGVLQFKVPALGNPDVYGPSDVGTRLPPPDFAPGTTLTFASLPGGTSIATPDPSVAANKALYSAGLPSIAIQSFFTAPNTIAPSSDVAGGLVIGSAVVNKGVGVTFTGTIDPTLETADAVPFALADGVANVPEPVSIGAMGLAALGLVRRRK